MYLNRQINNTVKYTRLNIIVLMCLVCMAMNSCKSERQAQSIESASVDMVLEKPKMKDTVGIGYIMGKFEPQSHKLFVVIPSKYADRKGLLMREEALTSYIKMYDSAKAKGVHLVVKSATRNFDYQKGIWERKWSGATILSDGTDLGKSTLSAKDKALKILEYSSMPGTSRHHWGTDIDLNSFSNPYFEEGEGKKVYDWLIANASEYGFVQVYTPKGTDRPDGYQEEKWHWSYYPIASQLLQEAKEYLSNSDIKGFNGSETAESIDVVGKYVLGVNKACFMP